MSAGVRRSFDTTQWSLVRTAAGDDHSAAPRALAVLCEAYWYPLYAYVRQQGHDVENACDLTQAFFARLIEHHDLKGVRRERGRFRSYLLASLRHFLLNQAAHGRRQKRGGSQQLLSIDVVAAESQLARELVDRRTPETIFERRWALAALTLVLERLEREWEDAGKSQEFDLLKTGLLGTPPAGYSALAADLRSTENAARVAVHRLRRRFRQLFREAVGDTLLTREAIEEEMEHLLKAVQEGFRQERA